MICKRLENTKAWETNEDFRFYNHGGNRRLFFSYNPDIFTQFMFKEMRINSLQENTVKAIQIGFPGSVEADIIFPMKDLFPSAKSGQMFFQKNKDFIVIDIPADAKSVEIEVLGKHLDTEEFEISIPHFLI